MTEEKIRICLWYDGEAEAAARFYAGLIPDSSVDHVQNAPADYPAGKAGDVLAVEFTLGGRGFLALNGGPGHPFSDAASIQVFCDTQEEIDRLWAALSADPAREACGWCRDRWGVAWQIVPRRMGEWMGGRNGARVQQAFMPMRKLDIAVLEAVAGGG